MIELQPAAAPGQVAIASEAHAVAWARAVQRTIRKETFMVGAGDRRRPAPIRIFIAAPNALSVAIGRELNATGRILLMDRDRDTQSYVESFDFVT